MLMDILLSGDNVTLAHCFDHGLDEELKWTDPCLPQESE